MIFRIAKEDAFRRARRELWKVRMINIWIAQTTKNL